MCPFGLRGRKRLLCEARPIAGDRTGEGPSDPAPGVAPGLCFELAPRCPTRSLKPLASDVVPLCVPSRTDEQCTYQRTRSAPFGLVKSVPRRRCRARAAPLVPLRSIMIDDDDAGPGIAGTDTCVGWGDEVAIGVATSAVAVGTGTIEVGMGVATFVRSWNNLPFRRRQQARPLFQRARRRRGLAAGPRRQRSSSHRLVPEYTHLG